MNIEIPSVLSYSRKVTPTAGLLYATVWDERKTRTAEPLRRCEETDGRTVSKVPLRPDECFLPSDCDTLLLKYSVKFLPGVEAPCTCNKADFYDRAKRLVKGYIDEYGFTELARRYAVNIANARTLWQNRLGAKSIEVVAREFVMDGNGKTWIFNAKDISIRNFDDTEAVKDLADMIAKALSGQTELLYVMVEIYARLGGGSEVYPSLELAFDEDKHKKSRFIYEKDGIAALTSRKIGNAIRTIDTWYPGFMTDEGVGPISAEVYGSVTQIGKAFRDKDGNDFYSIFEEAVADGIFKNAEQAHYVVAVLVRGGFFGQVNKT